MVSWERCDASGWWAGVLEDIHERAVATPTVDKAGDEANTG